jgi:uncharacterized protein
MILEGIVTTENSDGSMHVAPMGPHVDFAKTHWKLMSFQTSTTFANINRNRRCVFHIIDDALLLANAVLGRSHGESSVFHSDIGYALTNSCQWYALRIDTLDTSSARSVASASVVREAIQKPWWGWNRAANAVLEAAILVSRIGILESKAITDQFEQLRVIVDKAAGDREREAFDLLSEHVASSLR